jgi:hypothetical protein
MARGRCEIGTSTAITILPIVIAGEAKQSSAEHKIPDCFAALAMTVLAHRILHRRHDPRRRTIQYSRSGSARSERPRRTGSPPSRMMTVENVSRALQSCRHALAARFASELFIKTTLLTNRGRREGRELAAPMARVHKKSTRQDHRFGQDIPALPARWFTGLYVISPGTGCFAPVIPAPVERRI